MAGKHSIAPGGVIRTYGRLHPLRRLQQQTWLSPATDRNHLFSSSSSSSHFSPANNVSDDSDFLPEKRKKVGRRKKKVKPPEKVAVSRKRRKKQPQTSPCQASEKENKVLPAGTSNSPLLFTTPFRKFVTFRRKAPPLDMKPLSRKPKREAHTPLSSDTSHDCEVKRRRRKPGPGDSSADALVSPLLSSTPSVLLTAMPRTGTSFVRQMALCEPLEESVVRCSSEDKEVLLFGDITRKIHSIDIEESHVWEEKGKAAQQCVRPDQENCMRRSEVGSINPNGPGSGVKCLSITMSPGRSPLCLLSPVRVSSSPESLIGLHEKNERFGVFCASPELFSEDTSPVMDFLADEASMLDGSPSSRFLKGISADKWKYFRRKPFQPVVTLYSDAVTEYLQRQKKVILEDRPPGIPPMRGASLQEMQPVVQLDPHSVPKYFKEKNLAKTPSIGPPPCRQTLTSGMKTPSIGPPPCGQTLTSPGMKTPSIGPPPCRQTLTSPGMKTPSIGPPPCRQTLTSPGMKTPSIGPPPCRQTLTSPGMKTPSIGPPPCRQTLTSGMKTPSIEPPPCRQTLTSLGMKTPSIEPPPCRQTLTSPGMKTPLVTASKPKSQLVTSAAPQEATGRKVCISGFSVKRWGNFRKKPSQAQQQLSFQDYGDTSLLRGKEDGLDCGALPTLQFSPSLLNASFLNSTAVRNLDLSTESMSVPDPQRDHQRWARLRAALSLHRKKKVEAGLPSSHPAGRKYGNQSAHGNCSSLLLLSPSSFSCDELTDAEKVLAECHQEKPITFHQCLTQDQLDRCQKVGEGVYGEVFRTLRGKELVALKIIPIEGSQKVNGEHQKSFAEILPEIIISKELSLLSGGEDNRTSGFIKLHSAYCVKGSYPMELLEAWDDFADEKGTENERPDLFGAEQLFMILEFEFGGDDLERMSSKLPSVSASRSILHQVTAALAVAEEELRFEHRDLHWGNLLIETCSQRTLSASLQGKIFHIPTAGVQVKIIDYTLSRLDKDGLTVFCDLSADEDLFLGEGDLQFDVYRRMREENRNSWSLYGPHSNVLWLHYLCDKLLSEVQYVKKPTSASYQKELRRLRDFRREVRQFNSATDILQRHKLFN